MQAFQAMASEHHFTTSNFLAHKEMDSQLFKIQNMSSHAHNNTKLRKASVLEIRFPCSR